MSWSDPRPKFELLEAGSGQAFMAVDRVDRQEHWLTTERQRPDMGKQIGDAAEVLEECNPANNLSLLRWPSPSPTWPCRNGRQRLRLASYHTVSAGGVLVG